MERTLTSLMRRRWKAATVLAVAGALVAGSGVAAPSDPATALSFHPADPYVRVLDTRNGIGAPRAALGAGESNEIDVTVSGLPDDVSAVTMNITVVGGTRTSHLKVFTTGASLPASSSLAWSAGLTLTASVVVPVTSEHSFTVFNAAGSVHVVADLVGYYAPGGSGAEGPMGPEGPAGVEGPQGPEGPAGADGVSPGAVYAYASNTVAQRIHLNGLVPFPSVGALGGSETKYIVVGPDEPNQLELGEFMVSQGGMYKVTFQVSAVEPSQIDVFVNDAAAVPVATFGAAAGQPNSGTAIVQVPDGGIISLRSVTSTGTLNDDPPEVPGDITLPALLGGSAAAANAWIVIELLSEVVPIN
ncbi:MAG: hypothetical protein RL238_1690 [Actinomycetota bacterium]|jgi:hypothetical protein